MFTATATMPMHERTFLLAYPLRYFEPTSCTRTNIFLMLRIRNRQTEFRLLRFCRNV
jgi:hypothetical protein